MSDYRLIISPVAQNDLKDIYQFSLRNWGANQSLKYLENLKERFWALTEQPLLGIERFELLPGMRSLPVESHIVFYQVRSKQIEIIRVLHGRQDPNRHIK
jgi:toxin ParE1/3/4